MILPADTNITSMMVFPNVAVLLLKDEQYNFFQDVAKVGSLHDQNNQQPQEKKLPNFLFTLLNEGLGGSLFLADLSIIFIVYVCT